MTAKKPKRSKYGNKKVVLDGVTHASQKQGLRWVLLRQWERDGKIKDLQREVTYRLEVNGKLVCKYIADHVYWNGAAKIVEDVKSEITRKNRAYRIKLKLMRAIHGIEIQEV
jgi:hypothetical protein